MPKIVIPYGPRRQFMPFHQRKERWAVLVVHRRGGKTVSAINDLIKGAMTCPLRAPRFAYVAPTYAQAKDVAWSYLQHYTAPLNPVVSQAELHVTMPGDRRVRLYGADNYDRMRGIYLDGCVVDEPADMDPAAWYDVIRPALSDRKGWCVWIGTPKGRDAFYRLWRDATGDKDWFTMLLPASESGLLPADELESAKRAMRAIPGAYEREYECSFDTPVPGSVYGDLLSQLRSKGKVVAFEWDRALPLYCAWDLGWNDATSLWAFQLAGPEVRWVWHTRQRGKTAADMARIVQDAGLPVAMHYLPHDADSATGATGISYKAALAKAGVTNTSVVQRATSIWPGINAVRDLIPRSWFNLAACAQGIEALEAYHTKEVKSGGTISKEPVHDWSSHDADAIRTAAEALMAGMIKNGSQRIQREMREHDRSPWDPSRARSGRGDRALSGFRL